MTTQPEIDDGALRRRFARRLAALADAGEARRPHELLRDESTAWSGVNGPARPARALEPDELYRTACRGTVAVGKLHDCTHCGGRHVSIASGFVVGRGGPVVTARHVLDDADRLALGIMTFEGAVYPVRAILATSRRDDLAVMQVDAEELRPLPQGDEPAVGAPAYVLSHPAGRLFTFTAGMVSRYSAHPPRRLMSVTAEFGRGSSGAPVLDASGAVVGVALSTKSIHHHGDGERPRLQTVLKQCAPASALRQLGVRVG